MKSSPNLAQNLRNPKVLTLLGIVGVLLVFQNCGPTFVTDELGNVTMSSIEGSRDVPVVTPSLRRSDFPEAEYVNSTTRTVSCVEGPNCKTGRVILKY